MQYLTFGSSMLGTINRNSVSTQKDVLKIAVKNLRQHHQDDRSPQRDIRQRDRAFCPPGILKGSRFCCFLPHIPSPLIQGKIFFGSSSGSTWQCGTASAQIVAELTAAIVRGYYAFLLAQRSSWGRRQGHDTGNRRRRGDFTAIIGFSKHISPYRAKLYLYCIINVFVTFVKQCKETPPPQRHPAAGGTLVTRGASVLNTVCSCGSAQSGSPHQQGKEDGMQQAAYGKHPHRHPALQQQPQLAPYGESQRAHRQTDAV